ncbi:MAG: gliding motility-associated C-terminal domain-containing protein, partial [Cryomorphaceae bacterium]|nr:gliding motility-associated C-terminal domain-containing protein [Cryomorphaceae bacterium]
GLSGLPSGGFATYSVTVTDANNTSGGLGCGSSMGPVNMVEPELLTIATSVLTNYNGFGVSCFGFSDGGITATINGGVELPAGGYTYNWTADPLTPSATIPAGQSTVMSPSGLTVGNYLVTVTDQNGCTISGQITVTEPTEVLITAVTPSVYASGYNITGCFPDGFAEVTVIGGVPGYTYDWSNDGTTDFNDPNPVINIAEGWLYITSQDLNGCLAIDSVFMDAPDVITILSLTAFLYPSGDNISCIGLDDGSIDLEVTGGTGPYDYAWTIDPTTPNASIPGGQEILEDPAGLTAGTYLVTITDVDGCLKDTLITLIEPMVLTQTGLAFTYPSGDNIECNGDANGSVLDYSVSGGSPGYIYSWTADPSTPSAVVPAGQSTQQNPTGLTAGTYNVLVTDINGYNLSGCQPDGWIDLTITGGSPDYSVSWSNNEVGEDLTDLPAGTYTVTITDINGCQFILDTTLTQPQSITSTTQVTSNYNGEDITCVGASDGSVTVNVSGGTPQYTYEWIDSNGATVSSVQSPGGLPAGVYQVAIEDLNGCLDTNTITLNDPAPFGMLISVSSDYNGQEISCDGASDGSIDFTVNGGTPGYTFSWSNQAGQIVSIVQDPAGLSAGTYQVTATDVNGCTTDTSIVLTDPDPLSGPAVVTSDYNGADVSCFQYSDGAVSVNITGGTPGYTYDWVNSSGSSLGSNQNLTNIPAGTYTVTATDLNGCSYSTNVVVGQPTAVVASSSVVSFYFGAGVSCEGASDGIVTAAVVGGTPGYSYSWNTTPVQNNAAAAGLPVGTYTVTATDINGCTSTSTVTLVANPAPEATLPPPISGCIGSGVLIDANAGSGDNCTWTFSDGQVFNECGPFVAYFDGVDCYGVQLTVISPEGCITTATSPSFVCVKPNPVASFDADTYQIDNIQTNANFWNTSIGASSYFWYYGDGSPYDTTFNAYHEFMNGSDFDVTNYEVTLYAVSQYGCIDSTTRYIQMIPEVILYVPNAFTPDGDSYNNTFYPVLTAGYNQEGYEFLIFNRWGELIFESHTVGEGWDGTYKGKKCQDHVYTWKLTLRRSYNDDKKEYHGHVTLLRGGGL